MRESKRLCKTELIPEANCKHSASVGANTDARASSAALPPDSTLAYPGQYDKIVRGVEVVAQIGGQLGEERDKSGGTSSDTALTDG